MADLKFKLASNKASLNFNVGSNKALTGKLLPYVVGGINVANYYTKKEVDAKFATKEDINAVVTIKEWTKEDIEGSGE